MDNAARAISSGRSREASAFSLPTAPHLNTKEGSYHGAHQACYRADHRGYAGNLGPPEGRYYDDESHQDETGNNDPEAPYLSLSRSTSSAIVRVVSLLSPEDFIASSSFRVSSLLSQRSIPR
jgi:hypothetical protein